MSILPKAGSGSPACVSMLPKAGSGSPACVSMLPKAWTLSWCLTEVMAPQEHAYVQAHQDGFIKDEQFNVSIMLQ